MQNKYIFIYECKQNPTHRILMIAKRSGVLQMIVKYRHPIFLYIILSNTLVNPPFTILDLVIKSAYFGCVIMAEIFIASAESRLMFNAKTSLSSLENELEVYKK